MLAGWTRSEISIRPTINLLFLIHQHNFDQVPTVTRRGRLALGRANVHMPESSLLEFSCYFNACVVFKGVESIRRGQPMAHRSSMNRSRSAHPKTHDVCVHHTVLNLVVPQYLYLLQVQVQVPVGEATGLSYAILSTKSVRSPDFKTLLRTMFLMLNVEQAAQAMQQN